MNQRKRDYLLEEFEEASSRGKRFLQAAILERLDNTVLSEAYQHRLNSQTTRIVGIFLMFYIGVIPLIAVAFLFFANPQGEFYLKVATVPSAAYLSNLLQNLLAAYSIFCWRGLNTELKILALSISWGAFCDTVTISAYLMGFKGFQLGDVFMPINILLVLLIFHHIFKWKWSLMLIGFVLPLLSLLLEGRTYDLVLTLFVTACCLYYYAISGIQLIHYRFYLVFGLFLYYFGLSITFLGPNMDKASFFKLIFGKSLALIFAYLIWMIALSFSRPKFRVWIDRLFSPTT